MPIDFRTFLDAVRPPTEGVVGGAGRSSGDPLAVLADLMGRSSRSRAAQKAADAKAPAAQKAAKAATQAVTAATSAVAGPAKTAGTALAQWAPLIDQVAKSSSVPAAVLAAIMSVEDGSGDPRALSPVGAKGLMQVMPFHFTEGEDPYDPETNVSRGASILSSAFGRRGDWAKAAADYFGAGDNLDATDVTGASGNDYVRKFRQALDLFGGLPGAAPPAPAMPGGDPSNPAPKQFGNPEISMEDAGAICGPVAAVGFAIAKGRAPTLAEAKALAVQHGWNNQDGMPGPEAEGQVLQGLGAQSTFSPTVDWNEVAKAVQAGGPALISTPLHYLLATGYDPDRGFYFGNTSENGLKGGSAWMKPEQLARLGTPNGWFR